MELLLRRPADTVGLSFSAGVGEQVVRKLPKGREETR